MSIINNRCINSLIRNNRCIPGNNGYQDYSQQQQPVYDNQQYQYNQQQYQQPIQQEEQFPPPVNNHTQPENPFSEENLGAIVVTDDDLPFNMGPQAVVNGAQAVVGPPANENKQEAQTPQYGGGGVISEGYHRELEIMNQNRIRLKVEDHNLFLPIIREFFQDESATLEMISEENINGLNQHLQSLQS